jgi:hypothetical protein
MASSSASGQTVGSLDSTNSSATTSTGGSTFGAGGSTSGTGAAGGSSGNAGAGNDGGAGGGGDLSDCSTDYTGPIGGPREQGPEPLSISCEQVSDQLIVARYQDLEQKVPRGSYWEPAGVVSWWEDPCSDSIEATLMRAGALPLGEPEGQLTSDWSHEISGCLDGNRRVYSNLRCDYFDGSTLAGGSFESLGYLVSLLWWMDYGNLGGSQILGYTSTIGGATDTVEVCSIRTTFGDFGLCDEITLETTTHRVMVGGAVTLGEPEVVRTIQGNCN